MGQCRSQWSTLYHLELRQKAVKPTWLKILKFTLGWRNLTPKSLSYFSFFRPHPKKLILKENKSRQPGRGNCFQESLWCFFFPGNSGTVCFSLCFTAFRGWWKARSFILPRTFSQEWRIPTANIGREPQNPKKPRFSWRCEFQMLRCGMNYLEGK